MKKEAIEHYDRMIAWAEAQDGENISIELMEADLGEDWSGTHCPYCGAYLREDCKRCPLQPLDTMCLGVNCCGGIWSLMGCAGTRSEWIKIAKKVRAYIRKTPLNKWTKDQS